MSTSIGNRLDAFKANSTGPSSVRVEGSGDISGASFDEILAAQRYVPSDLEHVSGRLGVRLNTRGEVAETLFFDEHGRLLRASIFHAPEILAQCESLGIARDHLVELSNLLDMKGIPFRPYELYRNTGSDHGVDLQDLALGGLGSAYDWRSSDERMALADRQQLVLNPEVTTRRGIDTSKLDSAAQGSLPYVAVVGQTISWHGSMAEASLRGNASSEERRPLLVKPDPLTARQVVDPLGVQDATNFSSPLSMAELRVDRMSDSVKEKGGGVYAASDAKEPPEPTASPVQYTIQSVHAQRALLSFLKHDEEDVI